MSKHKEWFIIAIGGVTCGGKSTLAANLHSCLPNSQIICQDDYFYPVDSPHHIKVEDLDHINFDVLSSLNMEQMLQDVLAILNESHFENGGKICSLIKNSGDSIESKDSTNISLPYSHLNRKKFLIMEGFCILNYKPIADLCDLKCEIFLPKDECVRRRDLRVYDPPDIPGYFEACVWPEYLKYKEELKSQKDIISLNGCSGDMLNAVLKYVNERLQQQY